MNTPYPGSENEPKTDQERIRALEARITSLESTLNDKLAAIAAVTDAAHRAANEAAETGDVSRTFFDERVAEIADAATLGHLAGRGALNIAERLVDALKDAGDAEFRRDALELFTVLLGRLERIEKLLEPALNGSAKLMAERV